MNIKVIQGSIQDTEAEAIIVNLFKDVTQPGGATGVVNKALNGAIVELIASGDISGKLGETVVLYPRGAIPARRVIVVGLGPAQEFDLERVREVSAVAVERARKLGAAQVATIVHGGGIGGLNLEQAAQAVVEGSLLSQYRYESPGIKSAAKASEENKVETLTLVEFDEAKLETIEIGVLAGQAIAAGVYLARDLINQPSNVATPSAIAAAAQAMAVETGLTCRVLEETELRQENMNVLLAVNQGSAEPPKFIILEYKPEGDLINETGPIVLVGKGVTFDTGGYSLKSSSGMVGMKGDLGGAAAVIGAMLTVAQLNLPLHVVGLVPAVENMVSATAFKPNDVFVAKNGVSVEVANTDAEGRLILADALCYADTLSPVLVIDVATLTAGKWVALGKRTSALFVTDDALCEKLFGAGTTVGEPLWRLPLDPAYDSQLKSDVADVKNVGGRMASVVTAARFLSHFVGDWPWAHIDIAGGELYDGGPDHTKRSYLTKGGTGVMLRTLVEYLRSKVSEG